jgi:hypothetical protein
MNNLFSNLVNFFLKPKSKKSNLNLRRKNRNNDSNNQVRVFKPRKSELLKEKIKTSFGNNTFKNKQFLFGFKNFKVDFSDKNNISNGFTWLIRQITTQINRLAGFSLVILVFLFVVYLMFFDTFFLVSNYLISFSDTSHLGEKEISLITKNFNDRKVFGIIPNNQYWFANSLNLTATAKNEIPEIQFIEVKKRVWPNTLELEISTEPILLTMVIKEKSEKKYWRISQSGRVVTEDKAGVFEKLVTVETPIAFTGSNTGSLTMQDYKLENNTVQLNRFWAIIWLWEQFKDTNIEIVSTNLPSLLDTDIILKTKTGVDLYFNSKDVSKEIVKQRLQTVFRSSLVSDIENSKLAYMDFRLQNKRIVICYNDSVCAKK